VSILDFFKIAPKAASDVLDKDNGLISQFGGWIDRGNFTDQEKASMNAETYKDIRAFVVDTLDESTDRSKTRREIATLIIKFFVLMLFMCGMTYPINPEWSAVWFNLATSLSVGGLVTAISIFFFGSHAVSKHQKGRGNNEQR